MKNTTLTLLPSAIEHIARMMEQQPEKNIFRLSVKTTGCNGYMYVPSIQETAKEGDCLIECDAPFLFYVAEKDLSILAGTVISFEEKTFGMKQLSFSNPNAAGECGCGESFNLKDDHAHE